MAQVDELITRTKFHSMVRPILGLKVGRPWMGYGKVLFLELGELHTETVVLPRREPVRAVHGQATVLIHSCWRAETHSGVAFGIDSPEEVLERRVRSLRGCAITRVVLETRVPELGVELDGRLWIRSSRSHGPPDWDVFLTDKRLFARERRWSGIDHTLGVGVSENGRLVRWVCYDPDAQEPGPRTDQR